MAAGGHAEESPDLVFRYETVDDDQDCVERIVAKDLEECINGNLVQLKPDADRGGLTLVFGHTLLSKAECKEVSTYTINIKLRHFEYVAVPDEGLPYDYFLDAKVRHAHEKAKKEQKEKGDVDEPTVFRMSVDVAIPTIIDPLTRTSYKLKRGREGQRLSYFEDCPKKQKVQSSVEASCF
jgi:hypothetical protein